MDVVGSQVDAMPMTWPFAVFRDWESNCSSPFSQHSPIQSKGVPALHPIKGVRIRPPRSASAGSSGTAVVARKLARLLRSAVTQSFIWGFTVGWMSPGALTCVRERHRHRNVPRWLAAYLHLELQGSCQHPLAGLQCGP